MPFNRNTNLCILTSEYINNRTWAQNPHIKDIANEKAPNTLSTTQRVDELRRAKATKLDILAEFAKVEDSIYLSVAEEKDAQKHAPMRAVIESFGTEISGHADINLQRRRI